MAKLRGTPLSATTPILLGGAVRWLIDRRQRRLASHANLTKEQFDGWKKDLAAIAAKPNVVCKISGFLANGWPKGKWTADDIAPVVNGTIE